MLDQNLAHQTRRNPKEVVAVSQSISGRVLPKNLRKAALVQRVLVTVVLLGQQSGHRRCRCICREYGLRKETHDYMCAFVWILVQQFGCEAISSGSIR